VQARVVHKPARNAVFEWIKGASTSKKRRSQGPVSGRVTSRTPPTDDQWKAAKAAFKDKLIKQRQAQAWESFVQDLRARAQIFVRPELVGAQGTTM